MTKSSPSPRGDSFGTLGETVAPLQLTAKLPRSLRERQRCLLVVTAAMVLLVADASAVSLALPSIVLGLGIPVTHAVWVLGAFLVPLAALLVLGGPLGEVLGRKQLFVGGTGLFGVAALVSGLADDPAALVAGRFLQGVGAGLVASTAIRTIADTFPRPREQARARVFHAVVVSVSAGPLLLLATALVHWASWRAALVVLAPLALATAVAGQRVLDDDEVSPHAQTRVDLVGPGLLLLGSLLAVHAFVQLATHGWSSWRGLAFVAVVVAVAVRLGQHHPRAIGADVEPWARGKVLRVAAVLGLCALGWSAVLFVGALHLLLTLGHSVWMVGVALFGGVATRTLTMIQPSRWLLRRVGPRAAGSMGLVALAASLGLMAWVPDGGGFVLHVAPFVLAGLGMGIGAPALEALLVAKADAAERDRRMVVAGAMQHLVTAVGLAASISIGVTWGADGAADVLGARLVSWTAGLALLVTAVVTAVLLEPVEREHVPADLDPGEQLPEAKPVDRRGAADADMVALGLGGTNMMAMLWSIALGRRAVGVELRGSPTPSSMHWSLREDLWHHLKEIDRLMLERYGEERIPRRGDGEPFILHQCFYDPRPDSTADARADEVITGFIPESHIAGLVASMELIDDRWVNGEPTRAVETLGPVARPESHDPPPIGRSVAQMLADRSTFQVGAQEVLVLLRRYLAEIERMDLEAGVEPRCRLFTYHRVLESPDGFGEEPGGRKRIRIEPIQELDEKHGFRRIRVPGAEVVDLGVPELFVVAEGVESTDAARLGLRKEPMTIDRGDGLGPVVAQADYLVGLMTMYVGSQCRKRIASELDREGHEYWVRQAAIGHEEDGEIGWFVVEVPDFRTFDPIVARLVPPGTERSSAEYFAGYDFLVREYFLDQVSMITEVPREEVARISIARQPMLVTVVLGKGVDARVATNGVVAGDSFGTADFLTSSNVNAGMIGHASRVRSYWQAREAGQTPEQAIRALADAIDRDTRELLEHGLPELEQPARPAAVHEVLQATREHRRSAIAVDYRDDWSRIQVFVGRLHTHVMPPLQPTHPARRMPREQEVMVPVTTDAANTPRIDVEERYGRFGHRRAKREQEEQRPTAS